MIDTPRTRLLALAVLLVALGGVTSGYATVQPEPAAGRYPGSAQIAQNGSAYLGEEVMIAGQAVETDPLVVRTGTHTATEGRVEHETLRFTVLEPASTPGLTDTVWVYGTLTDPRTVQASRIVTIPSQHTRYMYVVSLLAGLWVLVRLGLQWRVDSRALQVVPRDAPRHVLSTVQQWRRDTEETDA